MLVFRKLFAAPLAFFVVLFFVVFNFVVLLRKIKNEKKKGEKSDKGGGTKVSTVVAGLNCSGAAPVPLPYLLVVRKLFSAPRFLVELIFCCVEFCCFSFCAEQVKRVKKEKQNTWHER